MLKQKDFYQVSLKLLLKNDKGEVLALRAVEDGAYAGYYDLPGGRIDTDEFDVNYKDVLLREVQEEIGEVDIDINPKPLALGRHASSKLDNNGNPIHVLYIFFEAIYKGGDIVISKEHTGHLWLNLANCKIEDYFKSGILEGIRTYLNL